MIRREKYPLLEIDDCRDAIINPETAAKNYGRFVCDKLVISFFKEAIQKMIDEGGLFEYKTIKGENEVIIYKFRDDDVLLMHGLVGCPATGGVMDELTGCGIKKVMFCGGGGVLDPNIGVGELLVVEGAIRDEGFSYHYIEPSRIIYSEKDVQNVICRHLDEVGVPYSKGIVWTTDAIARETRDMIALRKSEGARIVEMEQAGCIAVAQFRDIKYGAMICGGDDVSGSSWDERSWRDRGSIRYNMIELCREILKKI